VTIRQKRASLEADKADTNTISRRYTVGVGIIAALNLAFGVALTLLIGPNLRVQSAVPAECVFHGFYLLLSVVTPALLIGVSASLFTRRLPLAITLLRVAFWGFVARIAALIGYSLCAVNESMAGIFAVVGAAFYLLPVVWVCWCAYYLLGIREQETA
jgi:hypothetical protein